MINAASGGWSDPMHIEEENLAVESPPHYAGKNNLQCIDCIEASLTEEQFKGYLKGCILKYLWRYEKKGKTTDLYKARWYLDKLIETEGKIRGTNR